MYWTRNVTCQLCTTIWWISRTRSTLTTIWMKLLHSPNSYTKNIPRRIWPSQNMTHIKNVRSYPNLLTWSPKSGSFCPSARRRINLSKYFKFLFHWPAWPYSSHFGRILSDSQPYTQNAHIFSIVQGHIFGSIQLSSFMNPKKKNNLLCIYR